jgi:hypothetical protein
MAIDAGKAIQLAHNQQYPHALISACGSTTNNPRAVYYANLPEYGQYYNNLQDDQILQNGVAWVSHYKPNPTLYVLPSWGTTSGSGWGQDCWNAFASKHGYTVSYMDVTQRPITLNHLQSIGADVLIISHAWSSTQSYGSQYSLDEIEAIEQYMKAGHGLIGTGGTLADYGSGGMGPNMKKLAPLFGLVEQSMAWSVHSAPCPPPGQPIILVC